MPEREELVPVSEAKVRLYELVRRLPGGNVLLLRHGRPVAALVDFGRYIGLLDRIEDLEDRLSVLEAQQESTEERVGWEKVKAESGLME